MPQSYKTIQRIFGGGRWHKYWIVVLLLNFFYFVVSARPQGKQPPEFQVLKQYEYRFSVPEAQAEKLWQFVEDRYAADKLPSGYTVNFQEDRVVDIYFDNAAKELQNSNVAVRERLEITAEHRKKNVQLLLPETNGTTQEISFKYNRKPDKGKHFTTHPLLKLVGSKDRPALDSLLQKHKLPAEALQPVLEITRSQQSIHLLKDGTEWLNIALVEFRSEAPEHVYTELQIRAEPQQFTSAEKPRQIKLKQATDSIAKNIQQFFPKLRRESRTEYAAMTEVRNKPSPARMQTRILFGVLVLGLAVYFFRRKFQRKRAKVLN